MAEDIGLELSSSRSSSYQDLTDVEALPSSSSIRKLQRPPSYSDSFLILSPGTTALTAERLVGDPRSTVVAPIGSINDISSSLPQHQIQLRESRLLTKLFGVATHITLIGIFETVFYFQFISKSEDSGIQGTINQFLQGTLQQCTSWPANVTSVLADLLALAVNQTAVAEAATQAAAGRTQTNSLLQIQSWMYALVLAFMLILSALTARTRGYRINWREVVADNIVLVVLLGAYEAFFFETIIYRYQSLTLPELEQSILQQLGGTCGI